MFKDNFQVDICLLLTSKSWTKNLCFSQNFANTHHLPSDQKQWQLTFKVKAVPFIRPSSSPATKYISKSIAFTLKVNSLWVFAVMSAPSMLLSATTTTSNSNIHLLVAENKFFPRWWWPEGLSPPRGCHVVGYKSPTCVNNQQVNSILFNRIAQIITHF